MEQRDVLRNRADLLAQALLRDPGDVLAVDQDAAGVDIVEPLQQGEDRRFAAARFADQSDALASLDAQAEIIEDLGAAGVSEADTVEDDAAAPAGKRRRGRLVADLLGQQEGRERLGQPRRMLAYVDEGVGQLPSGLQDRESQGGDEDDVSRRRRAALP